MLEDYKLSPESNNDTLKIKVMLDSVAYTSKPDGSEAAKIKNRFKAKENEDELTIAELANALTAGYTVTPAVCKGTKDTWEMQMVFMVDIDNKDLLPDDENYMTPATAIAIGAEVGCLPCFMYPSFNDTPQRRKFRMVFVSPEAVFNINAAEYIQNKLVALFHADPVATDASRFYYGTDKPLIPIFPDKPILDNILFFPQLLLDGTGIDPFELSGGIWDKPPFCDMLGENPNKDKTSIVMKSDPNKSYYNTLYNYWGALSSADKNSSFFSCPDHFTDWVRRQDMFQILGINGELNKPFRCIFPERHKHGDKNPSAVIFIDKNGVYRYHCKSGCSQHGVYKTFDIIECWELLHNCACFTTAWKELAAYLGCTVSNTPRQQEVSAAMDDFVRSVINGKIEQEIPGLAGQMDEKMMKTLLSYADAVKRGFVDDRGGEKLSPIENIQFFASKRHIAKSTKESEKSALQNTSILTYWGILNKLPDNEINHALLQRAREEQEKHGHKFRTNFFGILPYNLQTTPTIQENAARFKEKRYTKRTFSRESVYRAEGKEAADRVFPQHANFAGTTKESDEMKNRIVSTLFQLLEERGYCTEQNVIERCYKQDSSHTKKRWETAFKRCRAELLQEYPDLKCERLTNVLRDKFNPQFPERARPFIYYRAE